MDVLEICKRETGSHFTIEEMEYVIEQYIKERKGVQVNIDTFRDYRDRRFTMVESMFAQRDLNMLHKAFDVAAEYFIDK